MVIANVNMNQYVRIDTRTVLNQSLKQSTLMVILPNLDVMHIIKQSGSGSESANHLANGNIIFW